MVRGHLPALLVCRVVRDEVQIIKELSAAEPIPVQANDATVTSCGNLKLQARKFFTEWVQIPLKSSET